MDTDAEPGRILNALAPCQQGHTAAANIKPPESPSTSSNARGRATQVRWISPATWETNTKSFSNILSWRVLPSRLNRAVERAMGFPAHPCGICPYYAARCIIRTNTARGSIKLFCKNK
jgi:hypothetical protein